MKYTHTLKYYSGLKRKKILTHPTIWMNLEDIVPTEITWHKIPSILLFHLCKISRIGIETENFIETKNIIMLARGGEKWGEWELLQKGKRILLLQAKILLEVNDGDDYIKIWMYSIL